MDRTEFLRLIEETDQRLIQRNIPVHARLLAAFREMAGTYEGPILGYGAEPKNFPDFVGPNLIEEISIWYKARYGDAYNAPTDLGRIPFLVRGQVYTARIPLAFGQPLAEPLNLIEDMTEDMKRSLTPQEIGRYAELWARGYELVYEAEDVFDQGELPGYEPAAAELIRKALEDRDDAVDCLRGPHPKTNISCFHSQQHAEKMMKAVLIANAGMTTATVKKIGHKLKDILAECLKVSSIFTGIQNDVALLANIPMDIRYEMAAVDRSVAVETYFAALRVGGLCATQMSGDARRLGTTRLRISS
jgi:HEPN domain-containing protein